MKNIYKNIGSKYLNREIVITALVLALFIVISAFAFNALKDNSLADDGCSWTPGSPLVVTPTGNSDCWRDGIEVSGSNANAEVTNTSDTTRTVWLAVYEAYVGREDLNAYLEGQKLFPGADRVDLAPGQTKSLSIPLPSCNYQIDLFEGPNPPQTNPDFASLSGYTLLRWSGKHNLGLCEDTPPPAPVCDNPDPRRDLESTSGVSYNQQMPPSLMTIRKMGNTASVSVKNKSDVCSYDLGLASYEVNKPFSPGTDPGNQEFINSQTLFDSDVPKTVGPGESKTFSVSVPQCAYQIDLFEGRTAPVPPDFAELARRGTHLLLDFLPFWKNDPGLPICGEINQCPADFPEVAISGASEVNINVGSQVNYSFSISGGDQNNVSVTGLSGTGLVFNPLNNTVTGVMPNETVVFDISVTADDAGTDLQCSQDTKRVTLNPTGECPVPPPFIGGNSPVFGTVGVPLTYQYFITGDTGAVTISGTLPLGLIHNSNTRTITGTPTQAGTFDVVLSASNQCGDARLPVKIIIENNQCPADFPDVIINADTDVSYDVDENINYSFSISGGDENSVSVTGLPSWLTRNGNNITGVMRNETVTFTISVEAVDSGTDEICDQKSLEVTFRPKTVSDQCPANFKDPQITSGTVINDVPVNKTVNYLITYVEGDGETDLSVTSLPNWLSFDEDTNTVSGIMPDNNTYSFKIEITGTDLDSEEICGIDEQTVVINPKKTGGKCLNCGGGSEPRVLASSRSFPPERVLGSFVVLSEIPETGVGGALQSILFTIGLLVISAGIAYLIASRRMREKIMDVFTTADTTDRPYREDESEYGYTSTTATLGAYPFAGNRDDARQYSEKVDERFERIRETRHADSESLDITGEMREKMRDLADKRDNSQDVVSDEANITNNNALIEKIEEKAKESNVLLSDEASRLIVTASGGSERKAMPILGELIRVAGNWYEREDGWLLLNKPKVKEVLFATYLSMVPSFIGWIAEGSEKKVFSFVKMLRSQEHSIREFIKHVVYELDNLYRFRVEAGESEDVNSSVVESAKKWNNDELEKIIETLIASTDKTYENEFTPVKLSLLKALSISKGGRV